MASRYKEGFIADGIDSISRKGNKVVLHYSPGIPYKWKNLEIKGLDQDEIKSTGIKPAKIKGRAASITTIMVPLKKTVNYLENNGYPFAMAYYDTIKIDSNRISATLAIVKNNLIRFDSIIVVGNDVISTNYLKNYLEIFPKSEYDERKIALSTKKISQSPFMETSKPTAVNFVGHEAHVYLYLKKKKSSSFNGIAGFLPDEENPGKLKVTGEINLKLNNLFKGGEKIAFYWTKTDVLSQELSTRFTYPFVLNSRFGMEGAFDLFKQDTTHLNLESKGSVLFYTSGENHFTGSFKYYNTSGLSSNQNPTSSFTLADVSGSLFGLGYYYSSITNAFNPKQGWEIHLSALAGLKNIDKVHGKESKDNKPLKKSNRIELELSAERYSPFIWNTVVYNRLKGGYIGDQLMFDNEVYRIGGLHSIRGIDERSIYASGYLNSSTEWRFSLDRDSYIFGFFDVAYYEKNSGSYLSDIPFGFGAGANIITKAGVFSINYGLARQFNNPVLIRNGKIHVGYLNTF